jgi:hypothetical protein
MVQGLRGGPLLFPRNSRYGVLSGISQSFPWLFQALGQIIHVLLTRAPLYSFRRTFALDLHVLSTPPAFVLSQDQTLHLNLEWLIETNSYKTKILPDKLAICTILSIVRASYSVVMQLSLRNAFGRPARTIA